LSLILKKFQKKSCMSAGANFVGSAVGILTLRRNSPIRISSQHANPPL